MFIISKLSLETVSYITIVMYIISALIPVLSYFYKPKDMYKYMAVAILASISICAFANIMFVYSIPLEEGEVFKPLPYDFRVMASLFLSYYITFGIVVFNALFFFISFHKTRKTIGKKEINLKNKSNDTNEDIAIL